MNRVRIALFEEREAAEIVRQRLKRAGIPAEIHDERGLAVLWFVSRKASGPWLEVPAGGEAYARDLLAKWNSADQGLHALLRCPDCGSFRVDYPQVTHKSLITNVAVGLLAALGLIEKDYYCEACHCMWAKQRAAPRPVRSHTAPDYFLE